MKRETLLPEHERRILKFDSEQAAQRAAYENHLEDIAFPHKSGPGNWIVVFLHPSLKQMCALLPGGQCCTLPDW